MNKLKVTFETAQGLKVTRVLNVIWSPDLFTDLKKYHDLGADAGQAVTDLKNIYKEIIAHNFSTQFFDEIINELAQLTVSTETV